ncbi:flavodoxin family protein [Anaeroselena agilis]|uniref:Flavodoxin family protein n=1 Tax=Anaeroselena agilis TaxID=3063788 RepID=A0ABU3NST5_9FIRM|nr:flavodoxin family protein [Selenomonadales bacterium 4137-cl]
MKRVLGIVGSPRRGGNTDILVASILDGARAAGASTETVFLGGLTIRECDGCHACWRGAGCPKQDDMNGLYRAIAAADALVLGTPVYWYAPTALMKGFVDRLVFYNCDRNRGDVSGKRAAVVVPYEEDDPATAAPVVEFFARSLHYLEMELAGTAVVGGMARKGQVLEREDALQSAVELGRKLVDGGRLREGQFSTGME